MIASLRSFFEAARKRHPSANSAILLLVLGNFTNNAITFFSTFYLSRVLSVDAFGRYSVCSAAVMTVLTVLELGLGISLVSEYGRAREGQGKTKVLRTALQLRLGISLAALGACVPLGIFFAGTSLLGALSSSDALVVVACACTLSFWFLLRFIYQCHQNYRKYALTTFWYGMLRALLLFSLFFIGTQKPIIYVAALYLAAPLLAAAPGLRKAAGEAKPLCRAPDRHQAGIQLRYGLWCAASSVMYPLCFSGPLYIVSSSLGPAAAAPYSICLTMVAVIGPLNDAVRAYFIPKVTAFASPKEARLYVVRLSARWPRILLLALFLSAASLVVYRLLFGGKYPGMSAAVFVLVLGAALSVYGGVLNSVLHYMNRPQLNSIVNFFRLSAVLLFSYLLIPRFGAVAGAFVTAFFTVSGEFLLYFYLKGRLSEQKEGRC